MTRLALVPLVAVLALVASTAAAGAATSCRARLVVYGDARSVALGRSPATSCPFARVVARRSLRYIVRAGGAGDGDFYIFAVSPVTGDAYKIHCDAHADLPAVARVSCRTGFGARVSYRWGSW